MSKSKAMEMCLLNFLLVDMVMEAVVVLLVSVVVDFDGLIL